VLDNEWRVIDSFDGRDRRQYDIRVAGPGALLVAKLHKLGERDERSTHRLADKDAHDIYRLLRAVPTEVFVEKIDLFGNDPLTRAVTGTAVEFLERLFRSPESLGAVMAGRAEELVGEPAVTATAAASLARDVLDRLTN
jgi:hypothetical protein